MAVADHVLFSPKSPADMDWASLYPKYAVEWVEEKEMERDGEGDGAVGEGVGEQKRGKAISQNVEIADIGCGFGGLLFALAPKFPETLIVGMS